MRFGCPAKLSGGQAALARRLLGEGRPVPEVAKLFKVHRAALYRAIAAAGRGE